MLTVEDALRSVLTHAARLPSRDVPLAEAGGCILGEAVAADLDLPPFDKSLVDGFAVRAAELEGGARRLRIGEEITAGRTPTRPLAPHEAAVITTGAPLPEGADAVVMLEEARLAADGQSVELPQVRAGQNRITRGRELRAGEVVLAPGERLNPARLGLLASVGRTSVRVFPRPTVAVVPTGDELVEPDRVPGPGQIRNSNGVMLRALGEVAGARAECLPIAPDDRAGLREQLARGLRADVLIITGGVSAGHLDLVPETLESLGVERVFHKVRLRPGKPIWFGVGPAAGSEVRPLVFGLPGNPVSGIVGFLLFVRPALVVLVGGPGGVPALATGRLASRFIHRGERRTYHPAVLRDGPRTDSPPEIVPLEWAGSADLRTVASADGFAVFPEGDHVHEAGDVVGFLPMS